MTAQIAERLHYQGEDMAMCTNPLGQYFSMGGINPTFRSNCTALWRGYVGRWEVIDDRLYLVELNGNLENGTEVTLETLFPGFPDKVFAHWYSGTIRLPQGRQLKYVHMGYGSSFERDLLLEVEKGVIKTSRVRQNGHAGRENSPVGYGIGGVLVFPSGKQKEGAAQ